MKNLLRICDGVLLAAGFVVVAGAANVTALPQPAFAQGGYEVGGFVGDGGRTWSENSVRGALKAADGASALIVGSILRQLSHKTYEFSDGRNKIIVKINYETWGGAEVSSHDLIEIYGRVRGRFGAANVLDVKSLRKLTE